jgi:hypothetical protein
MVTSSAVVGSSAISMSGSLGDHHPLALAARQLVGVGAQAAFGLGDADQLEQLQHPRAGFGAGHAPVMDERLGNLAPDPVERVEGGHRFLEDHRDLDAPDAVERPRRQTQHLRAAVAHRSRGTAVGGQQSHGRQHDLALSRAGLANHRRGLAGGHVHVDAAHGMHLAVGRTEAHVECLDGQDGLTGVRCFGHGLSGPWGRGHRVAHRR